MKSLIQPIILALVVILLTACQNSAEKIKTIKTPLKPTIEETVDNYLVTNIALDQPGAALLVLKNGQTIYQGERGIADIQQNTSINADTGFRIGSISKTFTAFLVMSLYENDQLKLDDSILNYMPEFDETWAPITIHHLLTHQSGIYDYGNDKVVADQMPDVLNNHHIMDYFVNHPELEFETGSQAQYSNTGYVLLATIVERISGMHFRDYLEMKILTPLGMFNTYLLDDYSAIQARFALNYGISLKIDNKRDYFAYGGASIVSTVNDMKRFIQAIMDNDIISQKNFDLMRTPYATNDGSHIVYGYGLAVDPDGKDAFFHNGKNDGYRSMMFINRENGSGIVILGNGGDNIDHFQVLDLLNEFMSKNT
jgi:CubicO group peptidase (beta-lactamase class C family)